MKLPSKKLGVNHGGRKIGEGRHLELSQEKRICRLINDKLPDQLKLDYALWTRNAFAIWPSY